MSNLIYARSLAGITDIAVFHGSTVDELEIAFHEMVDHYIEVSERTGYPTQEPYSYSENLILTISPEIHAAVTNASQVQGKSINQWAAEVLDKAAHY